jgi:hypothetical protein
MRFELASRVQFPVAAFPLLLTPVSLLAKIKGLVKSPEAFKKD